MQTEELFFPGNAEDGAWTMAVKKYTPIASNEAKAETVTMFFAHSVGTHKETWEPTIERLFELQATSRDSSIFIAEAWSIDGPNHGHAGVLNERAFFERPQGITSYEWARGMQALFNSGLMRPGTKRIGVGHSAGACALILSTTGYQLDNLPLESIVVVEPPMLPKEVVAKLGSDPSMALAAVVKAVMARRDVWVSREDAEQWLQKRLPWNRWHPAVLRSFVKHGLRDLPNMTHPDRTTGVTLACTKIQEAAGFGYWQDGLDALKRMEEISATIPTYCILGAEIDMVPPAAHNACIKAGRSSVQRIAGAGHSVVQEKPYELASAIWKAVTERGFDPASSKL
ncbi:alpha/beta-hydrolase [Auriscalpium vulgare]|uniref:Alpha/beta-hydrolase n=1 Tax=Auriscalpium vulgare TaxID=40419 RepID=A0ACB8R9Y2_9AGAM|nr:alpha/beta-hydrolase [Auriscalpium vulgare]